MVGYGFQTFGMLGHSHKLLLLHVPKPKRVPADQFDAAIQSAFEEKERLARHAYDKALSVPVATQNHFEFDIYRRTLD